MTTFAARPGTAEDLGQTPPKRFDSRWRLHRGGIVNVWYYYDEVFDFAGGRVIWRGTNGAGKSRALEMLLPFLLDADRRNIDATGQKKVRLEDLMGAGAAEQNNRVGYLWLELIGEADDGSDEYLTLGAFIRFSKSSAEAKPWYFTTPLRVGIDLHLMDDTRAPLSREQLGEAIGADRITDRAETHRERVRSQVFGLTGETGRERYAGLLGLLHVLRSPDVGNRIEAGQLPSLVSEALPPLSDAALTSAGQQLDALSETRASQQSLEDDARAVGGFLDIYRRYAAGVLLAAGDQAQDAAGTARDLDGKARAAAAQHTALSGQHTAAEADVVALEGQERSLEGTIRGIRESQAYADATELDEVGRRVVALRSTADRSFGAAASARRTEERRVAEADDRATEAAAAAGDADTALAESRARLSDAGMADQPLPAEITVVLTPQPAPTGAVRTDCDSVPTAVQRPVPGTLAVTPADPREATQTARNVARAAQTRAGQAGNRLATARDLRRAETAVTRADQRAEEASAQAETAAADAETAADARDGAAVALGTAWRDWVTTPATAELLGDVEWVGTDVGALLTDVELLTGDLPDGDRLPDLDRTASDAAGPARDRLADDRADLSARQKAADAGRTQLQSEAAELRRERDPLPAAAPWQTTAPDGGVPLWRAVDFVAPTPAADVRAGIEGALHAAGLLTAHLTADGSVVAADGQVLLTATGPVAARSVRELLTVDASCALDGAAVLAVLDRIALGDDTHPVWIATDGSWGNGPLRGRRTATAARHIGAEARAAARTERLAAIAAELAALDDADGARRAEQAVLEERARVLAAYVRSAPRSAGLGRARAEAAAEARRAGKAADAARAAHGEAQRLRTAWHADVQRHTEACRAFGLPTDVDELAAVQRAATDAAAACERLAGRLEALTGWLARHAAVVAAAPADAAARAAAEDQADADWSEWQVAAAEFEALRASVGSDAAAVRERLRQAETDAADVRHRLRAARSVETDLGRQVATIAEMSRHAAERAADSRSALVERLGRLHRVAALPGVAAAALTEGRALPVLPAADPVTADPAAVEAAVRQLTAAVNTRGGTADETAVYRAQQNLERSLHATFDVLPTVTDGVRLFELVDATGSHTVAAAHASLQRRVAEGHAALSDRERAVFAKFLLGGVAEELQRQLGQAHDLVAAMNKSLGSIRTSHGIGVRVNWALSVEADSPLARIRELVTLAGAVRTTEQDTELIGLITARVDGQRGLDPTAGYAAHLKAALDYRAWHEVEVIILGPGTQKPRRISKRSKLSQGETRFVSYVTLFAAVDAYLSGLPDTTRALRLIVLDDAFAKVDDPTIGELMGLLVRLDIDFAMTGHSLWGTYPQVPALDVYEVRRREGSAAITTHVHWDGHTRHLRVAP